MQNKCLLLYATEFWKSFLHIIFVVIAEWYADIMYFLISEYVMAFCFDRI